MCACVIVGATPLRCFFAIRASQGAIYDPARWAWAALEGIRNPSARPTALADTQVQATPTHRRNKRWKEEIIQLRSPSALQPRTRTEEAEEEKEGRREVIIGCSWAETDHPAGPVRQAAASLVASDSGMGGGERGEGKENSAGQKKMLSNCGELLDYSFLRLILVQICFENLIIDQKYDQTNQSNNQFLFFFSVFLL